MEMVFGLIEGAGGALVMVVFGIGAIITAFISAGVIVYSLLAGKNKGKKFYIKWACLPIGCVAVACGTFILRGMIALFFGPEIPQVSSLFVQTFIG